MTPQSTFMITAPIASGKEAALRALLASMNQLPGMADPRNTVLPFYQFSGLHVARFVILESNTNEDIRAYGIEPGRWPLTLAFIGDIDGGRDIFLAELVIRAGTGLRKIFSHCQGFRPEHTDLLQWMKDHNRRPSANYVNWRGRTVLQIKEEIALNRVLRENIPLVMNNVGLDDPRATHHQLREAINTEISLGHLKLSEPEATPPAWFIGNLAHLVGLPIVLALLSPLLILGAPFFFIWLRLLENSDPENTLRPEREHVHRLASQEDFDATNHFNVFGQVKPGYFRRFTMRFLLSLLNYASRHVYNKGYLTRIQSIHFARWVLLDRGTRVYFASNYDGSADSYMDDFINKVAWGLNLVFSNGVGYPRSRWLIKGGAHYEEKYKRTLRRNQLPSETWYKAYPGLTAVDLARNSRIRKGLEANNPSIKEIQDWLSLL